MKVGYTEFSYGYAFTENLIRSSSSAPAGAPVFPNLVQEASLGYDVNINLPAAPLFFQFKLPERMKKGTAFEVASGGCPGLTTPFFRIALMRSDLSDQHAHLIGLENTFPDCVFYAAPIIANIHAFNTSYNLGRVHVDSAFFSPREIGLLPDNKQHTIAYKNSLAHAYFCSDPQETSKRTFEQIGAELGTLFKQNRFNDAPTAARAVRKEVVEMASPVWQARSAGLADRLRARVQAAVTSDGAASAGERQEVITDFLVAREIARVDFGVEMVLAQPS